MEAFLGVEPLPELHSSPQGEGWDPPKLDF